jgi:hypothetical protein
MFLPVTEVVGLGGGAGQEWLTFSDGTKQKYGQMGVGLGTLGSGVALEYGGIWNATKPKHYLFGFHEIQIGSFPWSVSFSWSGGGLLTGDVFAVKTGPFLGLPGASYQYEYYGYENK